MDDYCQSDAANGGVLGLGIGGVACEGVFCGILKSRFALNSGAVNYFITGLLPSTLRAGCAVQKRSGRFCAHPIHGVQGEVTAGRLVRPLAERAA